MRQRLSDLNIRQKLNKISLPAWSAPFILLGACILAYGLLIPWLGLYSDDWIFLSVYHKMGSAGLTRYFTTNRPFWGMLFQVTLPLLGKAPWQWHIFGLVWHWLATVAFWWLATLVWPRQKTVALWAGLLFGVHPGFILQPIGLSVGHMFMVYTAYILSICFFIMAQTRRMEGKPRQFWLFTILAICFSVINLLSMEYFLLMHLMQPVFLWMVLSNAERGETEPESGEAEPSSGKAKPTWLPRLKQTFLAWLPYLAVLIGVLVWRTFFFQYQNHNYQYLLLERMRKTPLEGLGYLVLSVIHDVWETLIGAWVQAIRLPASIDWGVHNTDVVYMLLVIISILIFFSVLILFKNQQQSAQDQDGSKGTDQRKDTKFIVRGGGERAVAFEMMISGGIALLIAGIPFWLTEIPVGLDGFHSRFTLPFLFGAALLTSGLLLAVPLSHWIKVLILAILLGAGIGYQFQAENTFRREWIVQKDLLWQMAWRVPELERGTIVFSPELPLFYNASDTSQSPMFDWLWQPEPAPQQMDYAWYYPNERLLSGSIPALKADLPVKVNHLGAEFSGNTSRSIAVQVNDPDPLTVGCLHVMLPEIDGNNPFFPKLERDVIAFSNPSLIKAENPTQTKALDPEIVGEEPPPNHCYYFQKIDLAYQLGEYEEAIEFYKRAVETGSDSWLDTELVPVIGSFAHLGNWEQAVRLTNQMSKRSFYPLDTYVCNLWAFLNEGTPESKGKVESVSDIYTKHACGE